MNGPECHEGMNVMEIPPVLEQPVGLEEREIRLSAGLILAAVVTAIWSAPVILKSELLPACAMVQVLDLPCLFCGGTRAFAALGSLEVAQAFRLNPLATTGTLAILCGAVACLKEPRMAKVKVRWAWVWTLLGGALLVNWAYLIFYLAR